MNDTIAFDINNNSFFNPGCIDEINKITTKCSDFKVHVVNTIETRFIIALSITLALILWKLIIEEIEPKFSKTETYKFINARLNMALFITVLCDIALLFV